MSQLKSYHVTVLEVLVHTATVSAGDDRDAAKLGRELWSELGSEGFQTKTVIASELLNATEVRSMSKERAYLVSISARSTHHIWARRHERRYRHPPGRKSLAR